MRAAIAIPYFLLEILAFIGVVAWLGFGWAIGLLLITFFGGLMLAVFEMQRISRAATMQKASGQGSPGAIAGNFGLTAAGAVLVALPGFVSSVFGLLLIIPPTRAVFRKILAKRLRNIIEDLGVRGFQAANGYRTQASYGSFAGGNTQSPAGPIVIDETEIQGWTATIKPEDFGTPGDSTDGTNSERK